MEQFIVSARKYRPQNFESVVGQKAITTTLQSAISNDHLAQALLFCGPRGVGKTTCARILAKAINTEDHNASLTGDDDDFSFNIFELDAASNNSVEDIRNLTDQVRFAPQKGNFKIYIIDEVHMLSQAAFNAFLKTLEEPPSHAIFILATTEKHKIIPTILSRCQIFDFKRIGVDDIAEHLSYVAEKEGVQAEKDALLQIAQKADGAMRDALSIFDRLVSFSGDRLSYKDVIDNLNILDYDYFLKSTSHLLHGDHVSAFVLFNEILEKGFDGHHYITGLAEHMRNLLVCKDERTLELLEVGERVQQAYSEQSKECHPTWLLQCLDILSEADTQYKMSNHPRLLVELSLLKICSLNEGSFEKKKPYKILGPQALKKNYRSILSTNELVPPVLERLDVHESKETTDTAISISSEEEIPSPARKKENPPFSPTNKKDPVPVKVKPREKSSPGKLRTASLSLLGALNETKEKNEDQGLLQEQLPAEDFSDDQLEESWKHFINELTSNRKHNLATTLETAERKRTGDKLHLILSNNVQKREIDRIKVDLLGHLRKELQNYSIDMVCEVATREGNDRPYTLEEKFKYLAEKNPELIAFKNKLDLDLDF